MQVDLVTLKGSVKESPGSLQEHVRVVEDFIKRIERTLDWRRATHLETSKSQTQPSSSNGSGKPVVQKPKPQPRQSSSIGKARPVVQKPKPQTQSSSSKPPSSATSRTQTPRSDSHSSSYRFPSETNTAASTPVPADGHDTFSKKAAVGDGSRAQKDNNDIDSNQKTRETPKKTPRKRKETPSDEMENPGVRY
jgi:hypothetical protein